MLPTGYLAALLVTLLVEAPLYALALHAGWRLPWRRAAGAGVVVNLVTHPVLWLVLAPRRDRPGFTWALLLAEAGVCVVEWALLALLARRDRLALLVVCAGVNAASVLAGALLRLG